MIRIQKAVVTLLLIIMGVFAAIKTSNADEYIPENWWFKQAYIIDEAALPENIHFIHTVYDETALGSLVFQNDGDTLLYILKTNSPIPAAEFQVGTSLEANFIIENSVGVPGHRATPIHAGLIIDADCFNRNGRGEITMEPPPSYSTRMVMFVDSVVHIVPVTVNFSINPDYLINPNSPAATPTLAGQVSKAPIIVEGVVHVPSDVHPGFYDGEFDVTVHRWFKGEGTATIQLFLEPIIEDAPERRHLPVRKSPCL
jgi:hypothetical protein